MSLKSNFTYLLDKGKISKSEYTRITNTLEGHDRSIKIKVINDMKHRLHYEIEDAIGISPEDKKFMVAVIDQVADKMKGKEE